MSDKCPCGSESDFEVCCEPYLIGRTKVPTAVALMRARYAAYALGEVKYLFNTAGARARRDFDAQASAKWSKSAKWNGIEILSVEGGGETDESGVVEFIAHYAVKENAFNHHERAEFLRVDGEWRFIDGKIFGPEPLKREEPKVGRNDPCPCGSGKKHKRCCYVAQEERR